MPSAIRQAKASGIAQNGREIDLLLSSCGRPPGPTLPAPISSLAVSPDSVLAVASTSVYRFVRGKQVARYDTAGATFPGANKRIAAALVDGESEDSDSDEAEESDGEDAMANGDGASAGEVQLGEMIVFGEQVLALAADGSKLFGWEMATGDLTVLLEMPAGFTAAHLLHPATYLNKVLLGSAEGGLALYNIRTSMLIHEFPADRLRPRTAPSAVTSLTQSPAVDVVAISYLDGQVLVYDVRADEEILSVSMEGGVGPGGVSFRTDGQAQMMATASLTGSIALWDLNAGARLVHTLRSAHDGAIARVEFAPGQPLLLSAGKDNALRQWFFESPNAPPRLLKQRSGHQAPPHLVRHYGDDGKNILTAARDRSLRCLSVVRDSRSFELSQGEIACRAFCAPCRSLTCVLPLFA